MSDTRASNSGRILALGFALALVFAGHWVFSRHEVGRRVAKTLWGMNLRHYSKLLAEVPTGTQREVERDLFADLTVTRAATPVVSPPTGRYSDGFRLEAGRGSENAVLRFSVDGSVPTRRHPSLGSGLDVTESCVVRVKAFRGGGFPSETVTRTYIVGSTPPRPVVSLVLDPVYLFDKHAGIYSNPNMRGRAWERPVTFAILSPDSDDVLQAEGRLRIHGASSRNAAKKSFRLYMDRETGDLRRWFGPVADTISDDQSEWVFRHAPNPRQMHRDRLGQRVATELGLVTSPIVPTLLYLNGELWGVYDLRERLNPELLEGKVPGSDFTLLRGSLERPRGAGSDSWREFYGFVESHDLTDEDAYRTVERTVDLENLIDFWALLIFAADLDRPDSNMDLYRGSGPDDRWRFVVWDFDGAFNYDGWYTSHDTIAWHIRDGIRPDLKRHGSPDNDKDVRSAALFRKLMANADFRERFRARFDELLDGTLSSENLNAVFDDLLASYDVFRDVELLRFPDDPPDVAATRYDEQIAQIREFLAQRPAIVRWMLREHLGAE